MTKFSTPVDFRGQTALRSPLPNRRNLNQDAFLRRMERLDAKGKESRAGAVKSAPQPLDAKLLKQLEALDAAWAYEVHALLVAKRLKTPESEAIAKTARAATEAIVATIEATRAMTLAGLKVKARAILWRRHGEPLEESCIGDQASPEEQIVRWMLRTDEQAGPTALAS